MKFRFTRAFVTGRAGFIGGHIVDRLVRNGFDVKVIDDLSSGRMENLQKPLKNKQIFFVKCDIRDREAVNDVVDGVDVVFHEAALVGVPPSIERALECDV